MKQFFSLLIAIPLGILLVVLAVANRQDITVTLDPFRPEDPAYAITQPLYILLFVPLFAGLILGGIAAWMRQGRWRREAREQRYEAARYRAEAERHRKAAEDAKAKSRAAAEKRDAA